ncbi:hypothetical protein LC607_06555 [Nostoc sp. CHAB 5824]|nr:hypothetical protein [Nostoc sp. CHAB 5824]
MANLLVEVDDEFRVIKYQDNNKTILEAYKYGKDISNVAEVTIGKQIRFKVQSGSKARNKKNHN